MIASRFNSQLIAGLLVTLLFGLSSASATENPADKAFEQMLRGIDTIPTRASMEKRWPDAVERLVSAAHQAKRDGYTRSRAISFLSFFKDHPTVRNTLTELLGDKKAGVRSIAIYTLARTYGDPGDASLVNTIETSLKDNVRDVKTHAVRGLRWVRHDTAVSLLKRIAKNAPDKSIRTLADRTLKRRRF